MVSLVKNIWLIKLWWSDHNLPKVFPHQYLYYTAIQIHIATIFVVHDSKLSCRVKSSTLAVFVFHNQKKCWPWKLYLCNIVPQNQSGIDNGCVLWFSSLQKGDIINVTKQNDNGLWEGQTMDGRKGHFPFTLVEPLDRHWYVQLTTVILHTKSPTTVTTSTMWCYSFIKLFFVCICNCMCYVFFTLLLYLSI